MIDLSKSDKNQRALNKLIKRAYQTTDMSRKGFGGMRDLIRLRRALKRLETSNKMSASSPAQEEAPVTECKNSL
ncbi:MAG: hypothetical protein Q9M11_05370 [Mariprofundaceae bacterium]|nr:hypothetical protein [Mariprofundaceae bacterium]